MTSLTPPSDTALASGLVTHIDHVGIAVPDLDTAIAWYSSNLGMVSAHIEVNEEQGVREAMLTTAGAPEGGAVLQLLAPLNSESTIAKFIDRSGPGLQQLAYRVTDIDAITTHLQSKGVRLLYPQAKTGTAASRINFIHPKDAGGVLIELVEPAKSSPAN
ncbi:MAG: methylmalonyl-CoA epimerase [Mycobacteriaceae bacterium]